MPIEIEDGLSLHDPPICGKSSNPIFLLNERDFAVLGDGDTVNRRCPVTNAPITVHAEVLDGEMTYTYQCRKCDLYTIER